MPASSKLFPFRLTVMLAVLAATVFAGYSAFWWVAAERFEAAALDWIEARRAEGSSVGYGELRREGFPSRLRLAFSDPALAFPAGAVPWSWSGSRLVAEIAPWAPLDITVRGGGPQTLGVAGPDGPVVYTGTAETMSVSITSDRLVPVRTLSIRDLILTTRDDRDTVAVGALDVDLERALNGTGAKSDEGYTLSVRASELRLPAGLRLPLGEHVSRLALDADVVGSLAARAWPGGLFEWRDAGGVVEVSELDIHYGPLRLVGTGAVALDGNGQPMGAFVARAEGVHETLDALHERGLLPGFGVASAKLALKVLSRPSDAGVSGVDVSFTLQDRNLSIASFQLAEIPAITW